MSPDPTPDPTPSDSPPDHPPTLPVAQPSPPMDGSRPVPEGDQEVEKFLVSTDTGGGD